MPLRSLRAWPGLWLTLDIRSLMSIVLPQLLMYSFLFFCYPPNFARNLGDKHWVRCTIRQMRKRLKKKGYDLSGVRSGDY